MNKQELIEELTKIRDLKGDYDAYPLDSKRRFNAVGNFEGLSSALELINKLDEPEITEEQAWNKIAESYPADVRSLVTSFQNFYYGDFIKNPTLSKKETVEIPRFVADYIEGLKYSGENFYGSYYKASNYEDINSIELGNWINNEENLEIFATAYLNGYAIEPQKTLQVIVKNYDSTVYTTELPEDEAMKLIEGWKGNE